MKQPLLPLLFLSLFPFFLSGQEVTSEKTSSGTIVIKRAPEKEKHYKLIPLSTVDFQTVEDICRPMMSKDAVLTYEKNRNSVLVYDTREVIDKITKVLEGIDRDAVNIRIDVDFMNSGGGDSADVKVKVDYGKGYREQPQVIVKDGKLVKPQEIKIRKFNVSNEKNTNNTSQFIMTKSGYPATLWVGKTIVDPSWLANLKYALRPTIISQSGTSTLIVPGTTPDFKWANVGASMKVLPHYRDNGTIDVELYPEVSYVDGKGKNQAVKVEQLATTLTVADGQRIYIGGVLSSKKETYINLFGPDFFKRDDKSNALDMYLTATALKPSGKKVREKATSGDYVDPMRVFRK